MSVTVQEILHKLMYEPCKCGRTTVRMENLSGRADDMLVIRGVNVFPSQIEEVLLRIEEIGPHYEILVERKNRLDVMTISVELIDDRLLDSYAKLSESGTEYQSFSEVTAWTRNTDQAGCPELASEI